jgi:hypothetical protein
VSSNVPLWVKDHSIALTLFYMSECQHFACLAVVQITAKMVVESMWISGLDGQLYIAAISSRLVVGHLRLVKSRAYETAVENFFAQSSAFRAEMKDLCGSELRAVLCECRGCKHRKYHGRSTESRTAHYSPLFYERRCRHRSGLRAGLSMTGEALSKIRGGARGSVAPAWYR